MELAPAGTHLRETWVMLLSKLRAEQGGPDGPPDTRTPPTHSSVAALEGASDLIPGSAGADSSVAPGHPVLSVEG